MAVTAKPKTKIAVPTEVIKLSEFDNQYGLVEIIQQAQKLNKARGKTDGGKPAKITLAQLNELSAVRRMGPADPEQQEDFQRKFRAFVRTIAFDASAAE